jgi:hypothetical protein
LYISVVVQALRSCRFTSHSPSITQGVSH